MLTVIRIKKVAPGKRNRVKRGITGHFVLFDFEIMKHVLYFKPKKGGEYLRWGSFATFESLEL